MLLCFTNMVLDVMMCIYIYIGLESVARLSPGLTVFFRLPRGDEESPANACWLETWCVGHLAVVRSPLPEMHCGVWMSTALAHLRNWGCPDRRP